MSVLANNNSEEVEEDAYTNPEAEDKPTEDIQADNTNPDNNNGNNF